MSGNRRSAPDGWRKVTTGLIEAERLADEGAKLAHDRTRCVVAVKRVGTHIGLKAADMLLLDTLVAFTQPQDWEEGRRPIVWASNAYLTEITGFSLSTLKRHARHLAEVGVMTFRDSPNGKRWGHRDADGMIVEAYGFDLSPMSARIDALEAMARELAEERALCQHLRRQITITRRSIRARLEAVEGHARLAQMWAAFEALLERLPGPRALSSVLSDLLGRFAELRDRVDRMYREGAADVSSVTKPMSMTPREAKSDPHIRITSQLYSVICNSSENEESETRRRPNQASGQGESDAGQGMGIDLRAVLQACPEFSTWGRSFDHHIRDWRDLIRVATALRPMVGISEEAWTTAQDQMGAPTAAAAMALVFEKVHAGEVNSPGGYLRGMVAKARAGELHLDRSFFGRLKAVAA